MFHWCRVFVGISLAFAVSTKYIGPSFSDENLKSANLNDLIQKMQTEILRETYTDEETIFPRTHEVVKLPVAFYGNEFIDYTGSHYAGIDGASSVDYISNLEDDSPISPDQYIQPNQENINIEEDLNSANILMDINNNYDDINNIEPNIVEPLNMWPQMVPVYVPEKIPLLENSSSYDIDVLNPANRELLLSKRRPNRNLNDDLIADLGYKAIMKNILPTMSYVRGAEEYRKLSLAQATEYPYGILNGCSSPIIFICYPNIYNGIFGSFSKSITPATIVSPPRGDIDFLDNEGSTDEDV